MCRFPGLLTFIFRYDGDEPTTTAAPPAPQPPAPQTAAAAANAPPVDSTSPDTVKEENGLQEHHNISDQEQQTYASGQTENGAQDWNGGPGDGYGEIAVEPETHGTGIKEDG